MDKKQLEQFDHEVIELEKDFLRLDNDFKVNWILFTAVLPQMDGSVNYSEKIYDIEKFIEKVNELTNRFKQQFGEAHDYYSKTHLKLFKSLTMYFNLSQKMVEVYTRMINKNHGRTEYSYSECKQHLDEYKMTFISYKNDIEKIL